MNETATAAALRKHDEERDQRRLQLLHEEFRACYAPGDKRERDLFEAALVMLMREVAIDAQKPFTEAAAAALAKQPIPSPLVPSDMLNPKRD